MKTSLIHLKQKVFNKEVEPIYNISCSVIASKMPDDAVMAAAEEDIKPVLKPMCCPYLDNVNGEEVDINENDEGEQAEELHAEEEPPLPSMLDIQVASYGSWSVRLDRV
jgi:hypothetical protein